MADVFDTAKRSWIMSRVTSRGTKPEVFVAEALKVAGYRFQSHRIDLPGRPDFTINELKLAIFVNGCFWHWHGCARCRMPASNVAYWKKKIAGNIARDRRSRTELHRLGWRYLTIWECDLNGGLVRCRRVLRDQRVDVAPRGPL
jgi:DNA mismatch endonuclease (patch repair protein)